MHFYSLCTVQVDHYLLPQVTLIGVAWGGGGGWAGMSPLKFLTELIASYALLIKVGVITNYKASCNSFDANL